MDNMTRTEVEKLVDQRIDKWIAFLKIFFAAFGGLNLFVIAAGLWQLYWIIPRKAVEDAVVQIIRDSSAEIDQLNNRMVRIGERIIDVSAQLKYADSLSEKLRGMDAKADDLDREIRAQQSAIEVIKLSGLVDAVEKAKAIREYFGDNKKLAENIDACTSKVNRIDGIIADLEAGNRSLKCMDLTVLSRDTKKPLVQLQRREASPEDQSGIILVNNSSGTELACIPSK